MKIIIGNAWPYANGSLHIGRVCSWLPGDVLARYHRAKGDEVVFISGSDCHGAPIVNKARELGKTPKEISDKYHREFIRCFNKLGFSFDLFSKTDEEHHIEGVHKFILELYNNGYIYEKDINQYYCIKCNEVLENESLDKDKCKICGTKVKVKKSKHLFFKLSSFHDDIEKLSTSNRNGWRENAKKLTEKYLNEGLRDRIVTREIEWGVDIPIKGFEDKKIYVWIEALMAYVTASTKYIEEKGQNFKEYWNTDESRVYLLHGKENILFHSIIFPALLYGIGINKCNIRILSSQHLNLEGKTFSTNRNWAIWVNYIIERFPIDSIRYYLISRGPEVNDSDFTWREFINVHNNELVGQFDNFINRVLILIHKNFNNKLETCELNLEWKELLVRSYSSIGIKIENGNFSSAIKEIFQIIDKANKMFEDVEPWILIKKNKEKCKNFLYTCMQIIISLSCMLNPIMPFTCEKMRTFLNIELCKWGFQEVSNIRVSNFEHLFVRIDRRVAIEESKKLKMKKI